MGAVFRKTAQKIRASPKNKGYFLEKQGKNPLFFGKQRILQNNRKEK